jgi:hypothetical protein
MGGAVRRASLDDYTSGCGQYANQALRRLADRLRELAAGQQSCSPVHLMAAGRAAPEQAPESKRGTISRLEQLRPSFQAVIDYNEPLPAKPSQRAAAERRIAEAATWQPSCEVRSRNCSVCPWIS